MIGLLKLFLTKFTYVALALILVAAGCGVPIPEDVPLIFSGYLCNPHQSPLANLATPAGAKQTGATTTTDPAKAAPADTTRASKVPGTVPSANIMFLAGMLGIVGGDSILYFIGRYGIDSNNLIARHIRKVLHSKRRDQVEKHFLRHGNLTLFIGRFIPGVRAMIFALCGLSKMPYWRFAAVDGLAGLISVPTLIWLGYWQAKHINWLFAKVTEVKHIVYVVVAIAIVAGVVVYLIRRGRTGPRKV